MSTQTDAGGDWVVHRGFGTGEVLVRSGRRLTVRFAHGVEIIDGKFRPVAPDSLEVRAHRNSDELLAFIEDDPFGVARVVLRDRPRPLHEADLRSALRLAAVPEAQIDAWWLDILAKKDEVPWLVVDGDPPTFTLVDEAATASTSPAADESPPDVLPASRLIDQIEQETDVDRLAGWAFDEPSLEIARAAAKRLATVAPPGAVAAAAEDRIQPLVDSLLVKPSDEGVARLAGTLNRTRPLLGSGTVPSMLRLLLLIEIGLEGVGSVDVSKARAALTRIWQAAKPDPEGFIQAIQPLSDEQLAGVLARLPVVQDGPRVALLDALADAQRIRLLVDERMWRGLSADSLGSIIDRPAAGALLATPDGRDLAATLVGRVLSPLRAVGLATLVRSPELLELFDDARLRAALEGLARADRNIARMADLFAAGALEGVEAQVESERSAARVEVEKERARAEAAASDGAARVAEAEQAASQARELLRQAVSDAAAPLGAELRQVRIDGLRGAAEMVADIVRRMGVDALSTVRSAAERTGLVPFGAPGETVRFDGSRHSLLGGDSSTQVIVIEPGWEATVDGEPLVLVRALVRQSR